MHTKKTIRQITTLGSLTLFSLFSFPTNIQAGFDFGECSGAGTFEQKIIQYGGDYEKVVEVGTIPKGIQGFKVQLTSDKDIDIRLYANNLDKIVHWPAGLFNEAYKETKTYKKTKIIYSGYDGVLGREGHEYVHIPKTTPIEMQLKAFGYESGKAIVNYSWTGKVGCKDKKGGSKEFVKALKKYETQLVGTIPPDIENVMIKMQTDKNMDLLLYGADGTPIISWTPKDILYAKTPQSADYKGVHIEWSGFDGINKSSHDEYIKITGKLTEMLVLKVSAYESGFSTVSYTWGE